MMKNVAKYLLSAMLCVAFFYFSGCTLLNAAEDKGSVGQNTETTSPDDKKEPPEGNPDIPDDTDPEEKPDEKPEEKPEEKPNEPVKFTVKYFADGELIKTIELEENALAEQINVPYKAGYTFKCWTLNGVLFNFDTPVTENISLTALMEPITYFATFIADGKEIAEVNFDIEHPEIAPPEVPEKAHYTGVWETYGNELENKTINALYTPVVYAATFTADGNEVAKVFFDVEHPVITPPEVPEKAHYTGAWETYGNELENKTVNAVYTAVSYTATFIADGKEVAKIPFTVENAEIVPPEPPEKFGYTAEWEDFSPIGDTEIFAVYTPVSGTEGLIYVKSDDGAYTVTGISATAERIIVPAVYEGLPVTRIAEKAFIGNADLKEAIIYAGITGVEKQTFYNCAALESVTLPSTVKTIGDYAFSLTKLQSISLPEGVESIGNKAFASCTSLTSARLPDSLKIIGNMAFSVCTALESVTAGKNLAEIGANAFVSSALISFSFADADGWSAGDTALPPETLSDPVSAAAAVIKYTASSPLTKH